MSNPTHPDDRTDLQKLVPTDRLGEKPSTADLFAQALADRMLSKTTPEMPNSEDVLDCLHPSRPVARADPQETAEAFTAWAEQQFADLHDPLLD